MTARDINVIGIHLQQNVLWILIKDNGQLHQNVKKFVKSKQFNIKNVIVVKNARTVHKEQMIQTVYKLKPFAVHRVIYRDIIVMNQPETVQNALVLNVEVKDRVNYQKVNVHMDVKRQTDPPQFVTEVLENVNFVIHHKVDQGVYQLPHVKKDAKQNQILKIYINVIGITQFLVVNKLLMEHIPKKNAILIVKIQNSKNAIK